MPPAIPIATYRLQLTADFGFDQAAALVPYLQEIGISHLYASPFLKARAGSTHGYDVIDHNSLNPELGGEDGFRQGDVLGGAAEHGCLRGGHFSGSRRGSRAGRSSAQARIP